MRRVASDDVERPATSDYPQEGAQLTKRRRPNCPGIVLSDSPRIVHFERLLSDDQCDHLARLADKRRSAWSDGSVFAVPEYSAQFLLPLDRFFDPIVREVEDAIAEATGVPTHNDEDPLKISRHIPPASGSARRAAALLNVHHDRNDAKPRRNVTAIAYLSTVARGGETFFPLAQPIADSGGGAEAGEAAADAATFNVHSSNAADGARTRPEPAAQALGQALRAIYAESDGGAILPPAGGDIPSLRQAAALSVIESACTAAREGLDDLAEDRSAQPGDTAQQPSGARHPRMWVFGKKGGLLIRPIKGSACVFWSVRAPVDAQDGEVETSAAWHGAATVRAGEKLSVQKFKEAPGTAAEAAADDGKLIVATLHTPSYMLELI